MVVWSWWQNRLEGMTNEHCGYLQHDIRICDDGSLTIFDNSGCSTDNSRICRYWIDEESMQLVKFKEYVTPRKMKYVHGVGDSIR